MSNWITPTGIRLEASSACQLSCSLCPVHGPNAQSVVGRGFLRLSHFRDLIEANPQLETIELSNYGEVFLNPELLGILECAYVRGVRLKAGSGVNFNHVSPGVLEGLVKYRFGNLTCSIDGATEETYATYRVNGSLRRVLANIRRLNALKEQYGSRLPRLRWQFVVFGHNEHEIAQARRLALELDMEFRLKLSWDSGFSRVKDEGRIRREAGAASRDEYRELFGRDYRETICHELWTRPQINWDGRVLGCSRNFWGDFGGNVFVDGLEASINSSGMQCAREMLTGSRPADESIPCASCSMYLNRRDRREWIDERNIDPSIGRRAVGYARRFSGRSAGPLPRLAGGVYPVALPLPLDRGKTWKPFPIFKGSAPRLSKWSCHVSALAEGASPHPPHQHREEEILLLLSGEVDLVVPDAVDSNPGNRIRIKPGQFAYYPSAFAHTLETTSGEPANYLMLRWVNPKKPRRLNECSFAVYDTTVRAQTAPGYRSHLLLREPTGFLETLRCHVSLLDAGCGYEPHVDAHNVAIVVLEGEVETLGRRVVPHGVILYPAGVSHGMLNPGPQAARYLVVEFHGLKIRAAERMLFLLRRRLGAFLRLVWVALGT